MPLSDLDAVPRNWFNFVHLCDAVAEIPTTTEELTRQAREERLYPGEGAIDIGGILKRIPQVVYSIEAPHLARSKEMGFTEHAFRCLQAGKKVRFRAPGNGNGVAGGEAWIVVMC